MMMEEEDNEFYLSIQKAIQKSKEVFYKSLRDDDYSNYILFELNVYVMSSDYRDIMETITYSNLTNKISRN